MTILISYLQFGEYAHCYRVNPHQIRSNFRRSLCNLVMKACGLKNRSEDAKGGHNANDFAASFNHLVHRICNSHAFGKVLQMMEDRSSSFCGVSCVVRTKGVTWLREHDAITGELICNTTLLVLCSVLRSMVRGSMGVNGAEIATFNFPTTFNFFACFAAANYL